MPNNAIATFREDIARAQALVDHANPLPAATAPERLLRDDVLRSGWMFAVGAMDAYFCDAYADIVAATLICKAREPAVTLPGFIYEIEMPVAAILEPYAARPNWRWRMAARRMLEDRNALKVETIRSWFNPFCQAGEKVFTDLVLRWLPLTTAPDRLFGTDSAAYAALPPADKNKALKQARDVLHQRIGEIVQRRHDCIHACDRPSNAPQPIQGPGTVSNVIRDVSFIVGQFDTHIDAQFRTWLATGGVVGATGFTNVTITQVGY